MRVLLTGSGGQLARALQRTAPPGCTLVALGRERLDVSDRGEVVECVATVRPDVIINAAAYTSVDLAESEEARARAVNGAGPGYLAEAAGRACRLVQPSTDYVFEGSGATPLGTDAPTNPGSAYGRSKLEGERAVAERANGPWMIVRTAWVYSGDGRNFLTSMLQQMGSGTSLRVVDDQLGTPTSADSLATAIWCMVEGELGGIQHWTDDGTATWCSFAREIARIGLELGMLDSLPEITGVSSSERRTPARRPGYAVLDKTETWGRLEGTRCMPPVDWRENLRRTMEGLTDA